jgi:hypothetical protein
VVRILFVSADGKPGRRRFTSNDTVKRIGKVMIYPGVIKLSRITRLKIEKSYY